MLAFFPCPNSVFQGFIHLILSEGTRCGDFPPSPRGPQVQALTACGLSSKSAGLQPSDRTQPTDFQSFQKNDSKPTRKHDRSFSNNADHSGLRAEYLGQASGTDEDNILSFVHDLFTGAIPRQNGVFMAELWQKHGLSVVHPESSIRNYTS
jgi:hypothetical protein